MVAASSRSAAYSPALLLVRGADRGGPRNVLDRRQVNVARRKLDEWLGWAARSRLEPFVELGHTVRRHIDGILAYVRGGLSNGRTEGINGKARVLTRRAYGFHCAINLAAMLLPRCSDIVLGPVTNDPFPTL